MSFAEHPLCSIVVGILIFFDIFDRLWLSFDHYAMLGVWPQLAASERLGSQSFSLFFAGTSTSFQVFLLLLMLLLAGMFASGLHTRIVSVALWIMMVSLHNRNELVLDCGDRFLCCALFWCMFLPLGARFSLDAALHNAHDVRLREPGRRADASADRLSAPSHFEHSSARRRKKAQRSSDSGALDAPPEQHSVATHSRTYCGVGSVALVLQFALFYWQSTRLKWAEREWRDGTALYYAFSLDHIATPMAVFALRSAAFTGLLTRLFLYAELALSVLPLAPLFNASARVLAVALCLFLHAVFALLLDLGSWAWVPPCVALALLPSRWWRVGRQATPARLELRLGAHTPAAWRVALFVAVELLFDAARVSVHWTGASIASGRAASHSRVWQRATIGRASKRFKTKTTTAPRCRLLRTTSKPCCCCWSTAQRLAAC